MFGFLSRKRKEVQPDKVKKPAERENPATIPGVVEQDLDGLVKRIGISPQGEDNGSTPDRNVIERISPSGPPGGGEEVPEQQMGVAVPEWSEPGTSKGQSGLPLQVQDIVQVEEEKIPPRVVPPPSFRPVKKVALPPKGEPERMRVYLSMISMTSRGSSSRRGQHSRSMRSGLQNEVKFSNSRERALMSLGKIYRSLIFWTAVSRVSLRLPPRFRRKPVPQAS